MLFFSFSVKFIWHLDIPTYGLIMAHIPWLLGAVDVAMTTSNSRHRNWAGAAIAFLFGSAIACGFPQTLWFLVLTEAAFCLYLLLCGAKSWKGWATIIGGNLLGIGIGAVQLLTTAAYTAVSTRAVVAPDFPDVGALGRAASLESSHLICSMTKCLVGAGFYFGAVPLVLTVWWLGCAMWAAPHPATPRLADRWKDVRRFSLFLLVYGLVALWLALGYYGKLYYLQTYLPLVGKLRGPERFHGLTTLATAVLGGIAVARLCAVVRDGEKLPWKSLLLPWSAGSRFLLSRGLVLPERADRAHRSASIETLLGAIDLHSGRRGAHVRSPRPQLRCCLTRCSGHGRSGLIWHGKSPFAVLLGPVTDDNLGPICCQPEQAAQPRRGTNRRYGYGQESPVDEWVSFDQRIYWRF